MKIFLALTFLLTSQASFASQMPCEMAIYQTVNEILNKEKTTEAVNAVKLIPQDTFANLDLYEVQSAATAPGIMFSSVWAVVTTRGELGACTVESVTADYRAQ